MKKKNMGGGRPRHSKLHPQPSAMALSYLCQPTDTEAQPDPSPGDMRVNEASNDGQSGTVAEASSDSDHNRRCHELTPNTTGQMVVPENSCGLEPQEVHRPEECLEMDLTEAQVCIKCNKGGKLLVCSESNCPLAVHEDCMPCPARFDNMGNFYCSYCSYKRAMLEMDKARKKAMLAKKALSVFLDEEMMDGDPQKQKAERDRRKEMKASTAVGDTKTDSRNRLGGVEADYHFVQTEEGQCEMTFDVNKGAEVLAVNEQNDVLSRCGHSVGDGPQHKVVIEEHTQPGPIIACGGGSTCCMEEDTRCQFTVVQVDKSAQAEDPKLVDDHENGRLLQDKQQPDPLGATLVEKKRELGRVVHTATTGELDNADVVKEHEGSRLEAEAMQDHERGDTLSSGDDFSNRIRQKNSDISHGDNGYVSPHQRRSKRKNQNGIESPSVNGQRKSPRKLTKPHANVVNKEKKNATPESRLKSPKLPHERRKKVPWTTDEEEMLKEGVQKFSTMVNKNLPWKRILEFGSHVFDGTRFPADLKDKWRNLSVKECSTK